MKPEKKNHGLVLAILIAGAAATLWWLAQKTEETKPKVFEDAGHFLGERARRKN